VDSASLEASEALTGDDWKDDEEDVVERAERGEVDLSDTDAADMIPSDVVVVVVERTVVVVVDLVDGVLLTSSPVSDNTDASQT